jgi:hypothetical protein
VRFRRRVDTAACFAYRHGDVNKLCTKLLAAILTILVMNCFAHHALAHSAASQSCHHCEDGAEDHSGASTSHDQEQGHDCCHCGQPLAVAEEPVLSARVQVLVGFALVALKCPPDPMPRGIEHPPQLG